VLSEERSSGRGTSTHRQVSKTNLPESSEIRCLATNSRIRNCSIRRWNEATDVVPDCAGCGLTATGAIDTFLLLARCFRVVAIATAWANPANAFEGHRASPGHSGNRHRAQKDNEENSNHKLAARYHKFSFSLNLHVGFSVLPMRKLWYQ